MGWVLIEYKIGHFYFLILALEMCDGDGRYLGNKTHSAIKHGMRRMENFTIH